MGLKTADYKPKSLGNDFPTLPTAYAKLGDLVINRITNKAKAVFLVQINRETASTAKPIEEVTVEFVWDRKTDPAQMAYERAKYQRIHVIEKNPITGQLETVEKKGSLYGWQDDIVV